MPLYWVAKNHKHRTAHSRFSFDTHTQHTHTHSTTHAHKKNTYNSSSFFFFTHKKSSFPSIGFKQHMHAPFSSYVPKKKSPTHTDATPSAKANQENNGTPHITTLLVLGLTRKNLRLLASFFSVWCPSGAPRAPQAVADPGGPCGWARSPPPSCSLGCRVPKSTGRSMLDHTAFSDAPNAPARFASSIA